MIYERKDNFPKRRPEAPPKETPATATVRAFVLDYLLTVAKRGDRCPTNDDIRNRCSINGLPFPPSCSVASLARRGDLTAEIYPHNYRVVHIQGYRTAPAPTGHKPYKTISGPK